MQRAFLAVFARQHGPGMPGIAAVFGFGDNEAGTAVKRLAYGESKVRIDEVQLLELAGKIPGQSSHLGLDRALICGLPLLASILRTQNFLVPAAEPDTLRGELVIGAVLCHGSGDVPALPVRGMQQFVIAARRAFRRPSQLWSVETQVGVGPIARLRISQLHFPFFPAIRGVENHATVQLVFAPGYPTFVRTDEVNGKEFQIFLDVDRFPDGFVLWLSGARAFRERRFFGWWLCGRSSHQRQQ